MTELAPRLLESSQISSIEDAARQKVHNNRIKGLSHLVESASGLDDWLDGLGVDYRIAADFAGEAALKPADDAFDLFYAESVLQRIPRGELGRMLKRTKDYLSDSAVFFHRIDQKDINSQDHVDQNLWSFAYLRYPDWFFETFLSGPLNSQNRLRESDFIDLFQRSGLRPEYVWSYYRTKDVELISQMDLPARFRRKEARDLVVGKSIVLGRKGKQKRSNDGLRRAWMIDKDELPSPHASHSADRISHLF
jgi:hypothetical protein